MPVSCTSAQSSLIALFSSAFLGLSYIQIVFRLFRQDLKNHKHASRYKKQHEAALVPRNLKDDMPSVKNRSRHAAFQAAYVLKESEMKLAAVCSVRILNGFQLRLRAHLECHSETQQLWCFQKAACLPFYFSLQYVLCAMVQELATLSLLDSH